MTLIEAAIWTRRGLITGITGAAFVNSYGHTAKWFTDHNQKDHASMLALMPEAGVMVLVLSLVIPGLSQLAKWTIGAFGLISLGITFTANLSDAGPGIAGKAAALITPVFAVLGFMLEASSLVGAASAPVTAPAGEKTGTAPEPDAADQLLAARIKMVQEAEAKGLIVGVNRDGSLSFVKPEPVVLPEPELELPKVQRKPVSRSGAGLLDQGILWATERTTDGAAWPTVGEIMAQFPEMSRSTAKRVRSAGSSKSDESAKIEESVNA
jgi:hypothetical protein